MHPKFIITFDPHREENFPARAGFIFAHSLYLAALLLLLASFAAHSSDFNVDRPGNDISNFDLNAADPQLCETACGGNGACAAWTYVQPGVQGPKARCWLKDRVPPPKDNACCTSGIKHSDAYLGAGVDIQGSDYSNFDLASASSDLCSQACQADAVCAAWTYVKPGVQGNKARCWLKTAVPPPRPDNCCTSGAKPYDGIERGMDRPGSDIANFDLAGADPTQCRQACDGNASCEAWSYVKPGVQGQKARCWLKGTIPAAVENGCCASGIKKADTWSTRYGFAQACAAEMGSLPDFNCMNGELLPIAKTSYNAANQAVTTSMTQPGPVCDKPVVLGIPGGQCMPYARLLRLRTDKPNVETAVICRKYWASNNISNSRFDDIAVIQHNKTTGNTCFYQSRLNENQASAWIDGTRVPSPVTDTAAARDVWLETNLKAGPGGINCGSCHAGGPFILSPYAAQKADPSKWNPTGAYHSDPFGIFANAAKPTTMSPAGNACLQCHRLGANSWPGIGKRIGTASWGGAYPGDLVHFMPLPTALSNKDWHTAYDPPINQLDGCAKPAPPANCLVQ